METTTSSKAKPSASLADYVWLHMAGIFGHAFTSAFGDNSRSHAGAEWATALAGFNRAQIDRGLDACRNSGAEFPPSATRFKAMCLGIPTFAQVNAEILTATGATRSPFSRLVWSHINAYAHRHVGAKEAERMRRDAYELACSEVMDGKPLPLQPAGELEAPDATELPSGIPATREGRIAKLQSLLGEVFNPRAAQRSMEDLHREQDRSERVRDALNGGAP